MNKLARPALRLALMALVVGVILGLLVPRLFASSSPSGVPLVHVVSNGETLWKIAAKISPNEDPRSFVYRVTALNGLQQGQIFPGQRILLPSR